LLGVVRVSRRSPRPGHDRWPLLRGRLVAGRIEPDDLVGSAPKPALSARSSAQMSCLPSCNVAFASWARAWRRPASSPRTLVIRYLPPTGPTPTPSTAAPKAFGRTAADRQRGRPRRPRCPGHSGRPGSASDFTYLCGEICIGGAAVIDGQMMTGRHGWAARSGTCRSRRPPCPCGSTGCLERHA